LSSLLRLGLAAALMLGAGHGVRRGGAQPDTGEVRAATTGPRPELVRTIPIGRTRQEVPRVVMSLDPADLGSLEPGTTLRLDGEVQVSLTCVDPQLPRCIGRTYRFSPDVVGQLVLAPDITSTSAPFALPLGSPRRVRCRAEPIANRNHHCVLVFDDIARVPSQSQLPCAVGSCFVNLVVRASARQAVPGDRLVIGADERSGAVRQNKGRLAAVVIPPGVQPRVWQLRTTQIRHAELPELQDGGLRAVYSVRLPTLAPDDVLAATARQVTGIRHLGYAAYVSDQLVLARSPDAVRPAQPSAAADGGHITAANGFNCTPGPSAYQTPCAAPKAGATWIIRPPGPGPYYVNLVSRSKPKHVAGQPGDFARVLRRGFLEVTRYR
jgi:hypothetical protein